MLERVLFAEGDRVRWTRKRAFGVVESGVGVFLLEWVGLDGKPVYNVRLDGRVDPIHLHPQFGDALEAA